MRRWVAAALVLVVTGAGLVGPATAQDGGTRSVFARGSGLRGLGMGGAYTAVWGDPTVVDWNPAGLAGSSRNQVVLGRTSYFGDEVAESYVSTVVPSWRWGAAGVSIRHLGTSGIEQRDDRNQVLEGDLSSSDVQVALALAREMGESWSLGGALKVQRQQLAGESASGLGVDVGLRVEPSRLLGWDSSWADGVALAMTFANIVEPSWRLDEDIVADPSAFRAGVAYQRPFLSGGGILAAVDFETSSGSDTETRAGLEIRLHPMVSLRTGMGSNGPAVGAGLLWNDLAFDYVLEDTGLGSVHRLGVSLEFGSSTTERQAAFVQRQEEEVQRRLEEDFARRQSERVEALLAEARAARSEGRFEDALATIDVARTLSPEREDAQTLEAGCWMDRGMELRAAGRFADAALAFGRVLDLSPGLKQAELALEEVQAESDQRAARASHLREIYAQGMDAFSRGDLVQARDAFGELLAENAKDVDAEAMLRRTNEAIQREARRHVDQARSWIRLGRLEDASGEVASARALDPAATGLRSVEAEIARRRDQAEVDATREPAKASVRAESTGRSGAAETPPPSSQPQMAQNELEDLYRHGVDASRSSRPEDAIRYFELVYVSSPEFSQVRESLVRECLALGMERFASGRLDDAISLWRRAVEVDPNDTKARGYLDRALRHRSRTQEILGGEDSP